MPSSPACYTSQALSPGRPSWGQTGALWADPQEGGTSTVPACVWEMGRLAAKPVGALLMVTATVTPTVPGAAPHSQSYKARVRTAGAELREAPGTPAPGAIVISVPDEGVACHQTSAATVATGHAFW